MRSGIHIHVLWVCSTCTISVSKNVYYMWYVVLTILFKMIFFFKVVVRGTWVTQMVKHLTPDFGSRHNLWALRSSPMSGSAA